MTEAVVLSREGPVAVVTLNRPEVRNALGPEMVEALGKVLQSLAEDPAVRAVVLTGAGSAFSAGADLGALRALRDGTPPENDPGGSWPATGRRPPSRGPSSAPWPGPPWREGAASPPPAT